MSDKTAEPLPGPDDEIPGLTPGVWVANLHTHTHPDDEPLEPVVEVRRHPKDWVMTPVLNAAPETASIEEARANVRAAAQVKPLIRAVLALRHALLATTCRCPNGGYDWNADPNGITLVQGDALETSKATLEAALGCKFELSVSLPGKPGPDPRDAQIEEQAETIKGLRVELAKSDAYCGSLSAVALEQDKRAAEWNAERAGYVEKISALGVQLQKAETKASLAELSAGKREANRREAEISRLHQQIRGMGERLDVWENSAVGKSEHQAIVRNWTNAQEALRPLQAEAEKLRVEAKTSQRIAEGHRQVIEERNALLQGLRRSRIHDDGTSVVTYHLDREFDSYVRKAIKDNGL